MGLLDTILGSIAGQSDESTTTARAQPGGAIAGVLATLLAQSGGLSGLMKQFSQGGLGEIFSSWTGTGQNQSISPDQVHQALGPSQLQALGSSLGLDTSQVSSLLAEYLPTVVDKLTPAGQIDPTADDRQGLEALLPSLLAGLGGNARHP